MVEYAVSMKAIHDVLAKNANARILDIGAGTGRYSVALAREGFDVTAVELVSQNLKVLRSKHENVKTWQGNALDLHFLSDKSFDLTILFGPLYHLHTQDEKLKCLKEAKRVTKNGGTIFASYIMNEYSVIQYCFKSHHILEGLENGSVTKDFKIITKDDDLYSYTRLEDINCLNELCSLERTDIFASDGAADYMRRELNALSEKEFEEFIKYQMTVCRRLELLGASSHVVDVLRV